jgi:hypothetical protein
MKEIVHQLTVQEVAEGIGIFIGLCHVIITEGTEMRLSQQKSRQGHWLMSGNSLFFTLQRSLATKECKRM